MEEFRNDCEDNESSDDELEFEVHNENMNNESDSSDDYIVPPKRRNVLRIDSDTENSEDDDEEHLEQIEDSSKSDEWEDVTEKDDLPFSFTFKTAARIVGPQISQNITKPLDFFKCRMSDAETGYVYSILPYYGSLTTESLEKPELPVSSRIPLTLVQKLLDNISNAEGYHLYTDRYFTSIPLANEILKLKVHLTGTVMPTRKYLPAAIKKPKFSTKSTVIYSL